MRKIKILTGTMLLAFMLLFNNFQVSAQRPQGGNMKEQLGLTDDQTAKLKQINQDAKEKLKALKANPPADKKAEREQMRSIHQEKRQKLEGILNKDQLAKLEAIEKERKEERMEKRNQPVPPPQALPVQK